MTGHDVKELLKTALQNALPDAVVKDAFTGVMQRRPEKPVVCLDVLKEERSGGITAVQLGLWLYVRAAEQTAMLFNAVCSVMSGLPFAVRQIARDGMQSDPELGCLVTACRLSVEVQADTETTQPLRFGDFTFQYIPGTLEIRRVGHIEETVEISGKQINRCTGGGCREVTGSGAFFGETAAADFEALEAVFGKTDTLFLPGMKPFAAIFGKVSVTEAVKGHSVRFDFGFTEEEEQDKGFSGRVYRAKAGESLWDYAEKAGVTIDELVKENPQIRCINALCDGEEVRIP